MTKGTYDARLKPTGQLFQTERTLLRRNCPHRNPVLHTRVHSGGRVRERSPWTYSMWHSTVKCVFVLSSHIVTSFAKSPVLSPAHRGCEKYRAVLHTLSVVWDSCQGGGHREEVWGGGRQNMTSSCGERDSVVCCEHRPQGCIRYASLQWQPQFFQVLERFLWLEEFKLKTKQNTWALYYIWLPLCFSIYLI